MLHIKCLHVVMYVLYYVHLSFKQKINKVLFDIIIFFYQKYNQIFKFTKIPARIFSQRKFLFHKKIIK